MTQKISILGCGWLGLPLAEELTLVGYSVKGSTTSIDKKEHLKERNISPFLIDIKTRENKFSEFLESEILIVNIPHKSIPDFEYLIRKIEASSIEKVIFISSTSVYENTNKIVSETSETKNVPLVVIEHIFQNNPHFETTIIRFGGLFGGNRKPGSFIKKGRKIENPEGYMNLIHRVDCIGIIQKIIELNCWNQVFNACSPSHPTRSDFYLKELKKEGRIAEINKNSIISYKIVSTDKLKNLLNYTFELNDLMES